MSDQYNRSRSKLRRRIQRKQQPGKKRTRRARRGLLSSISLRRLIRKINVSFRRTAGKAYDNLDSWVAPLVGIVLLAAVIGVAVWVFTNKNAFEVMLDDVQMGIIAKNKKITAQELQSMAEKKLSSELEANVQVKEKVTITPVHASKKEMVGADVVIGKIYKAFTYTIEATVIKVDGVEIVNLKNDDEAKELLNSIIEEYVDKDLNIVKKGFVEDVITEKKFMDTDDIVTMEVAKNKLCSSVESSKSYTVEAGDTLSKIAASQNLSVDALLSMNPSINITSILEIGEQLTIVVPKPLLSVRTASEIKYPDVAEKPVETRENPNQPSSYKKVIKQGKDGQKEVVAHIIRVNGFETGEREIIKETTTTEPVAEVVEVGTKTG